MRCVQCIVWVVLVMMAGQVCAADVSDVVSIVDPEPGWPMVSGPYGNFNPRQYGHRLVDSLGQARVLWKSDTGVLGMGKMFRKGGGSAGQPPGTAGGVIVAQGLVFGNSFQPRANGRGLPFEGRSLRETQRMATGEMLEHLLSFWSVEADDVFVAYDQRTGRTVWQVNEINKGIHRGMAKRSGFHNTPVYCNGKLFCIGTTLRVYAYDAATGRKLWESDLGPAHGIEEMLKQQALDVRCLPGSGGFGSAAVAASPAGSTDRAVVVMPRYAGGGLIGFDADTGAVLWEITEEVQSQYSAPAVWTHEGRQYLLTTSRGPAKPDAVGIFRMIDPGTGKILWSEEIAPMWKPVITSGKYAFVLLPVTTMTPEEVRLDPYGRARYGCYEISPSGAKLIWALPDNFRSSTQNHMDCGPMREVVVRDGLMIWHNNGGHMAVHRLETGEKLFERFCWEDKKEPKLHGSYGYFLEDRYFYVADAAHSGLAGGVFFSLKPPDFASLGPSADVPGADRATTGYEVFLENPYVDGIMYVRTQTEGKVNAIDLRKDPPRAAPTPLPLPEWAAKLPESLRMLASRYRDERDAAAAKFITLPVAQRPLPELLILAGHQDHLLRQAAATVLAASTDGLNPHAAAIRKLAVDAVTAGDEDGLEMFIPIALDLGAPAMVKALELLITPRLHDATQSRLALRALGLTGKAGSGMVNKVLPLLRDKDERVVFEATHCLARIGGGNAEVVVALLKVLGPIGAQWCDLKRPLAAAGAIAALRHLSETGGIPAAPEKLLPLCAENASAGQRRFAHPYNSALNRSLSYGMARMRVAAHQGPAAVEPLTLETAVLLAPFYEANAGGLVGALASGLKEPRIQSLIQEIAAGNFGNETIAAKELLAKMGIQEEAPPTLKEEPKMLPSLDDALGL